MSADGHVVVGAGPAGLTAAWQLCNAGARVTVLESDREHVGGLARTIELHGHRFDIGPHRFYTKSDAVQRMWHAMLPDQFVTVQRLTRIYYERCFHAYPIKVAHTLRLLGARRALRVAGSWACAQLRPRRPVRSFEDWVVNAFGQELYRTFFQTYTEKVWGVPCSTIDKDWAAQRIRGLSLPALLRKALLPRRFGGGVQSLVEEFIYPRRGAGQLWQAVRDQIVRAGQRVALAKSVIELHHDRARVSHAVTADGEHVAGANFYSTMTLRALVNALRPPPPPDVLAAGNALTYRDFFVVALLLDQPPPFPDQWIYVHDPGVRVARITCFDNWSSAPALRAPCRLVLEYFANRDQPLWQADDAALIDRATGELNAIGLPCTAPPLAARVVRVPDAYPVYDHGYRAHRETLKGWLAAALVNLHPAGRGGLHNYNSQDHAMMSAVLAVRNALAGERHDVWSVNTAQEYAEETTGSAGERLVPRTLA